MSISISQINNLRKKTGAGILDCKKALLKSSGDFDKAIDIVRTMGKTFHDSNRKVLLSDACCSAGLHFSKSIYNKSKI